MFHGMMLAALLILLPAAANAECNYPAFEYHPEKNDFVVVDMVVKAETECTHNFREGPGYRFTDITFEHTPDHGAMRKVAAARYIYRPERGFKGKDAYIFKICATKGDEKGCSTIGFVATVQ